MLAAATLPTLRSAVRASSSPSSSLRAARSVAATPRLATPLRTFATSRIAQEIKTRYTVEHEWVAFDTESNIGTIGITDYAQKSLGDVVYVELPSEDSEVKQGEQIGSVESVKAASDVFSPVTGAVTAVNGDLADQPSLLNKDPEAKGWLCKIRLHNPSEFEALLEKDAYTKLTDEASH